MKTSIHKSRGFTLVETLIAISILILAVTGAFAAAQNGISSAIFSKDQIVAFYLAQEGVEHIRNLRDQNGIAGVNWLRGIAMAGDPCAGTSCKIDAVAGTISSCGAGSCDQMLQNEEGFYGYIGSIVTPFTRTITVTPINNNEASITVVVNWSKGLVQRSFKARENILNWQ
jgi:type II secretory pathway pseudopilin PulG